MVKIAQLRATRTLPELAHVLGVKPASLSFVLYWLPREIKYSKFEIPKKSGGFRTIMAPEPRLKMVQRKLCDALQSIQAELEKSRTRNECVISHGFKNEFSIITNATAHRNKRYVFNADLKDFFPSINFGRVRGFFATDRNFALDPRIATIIAQLACHDNELPQGSPCSPVISNLIAHILDMHLNRVARASRCTYTRYADDLKFSTNEKNFPDCIAHLKPSDENGWMPGNSLVKYVYRSGFKLNHEKTRMQLEDSRQDLTGLVVNKKVNVRNEYYKLARAKCHHLFLNGYSHSPYKNLPMSNSALAGEMSFIYQIRSLKTSSWSQDQKGFTRLYKQFLDHQTFHGILRTRVICEGKTDNIYLRCAVAALAVKFPDLIEASSGKLKLDFFNYTKASGIFQDLSGGTGQLLKLMNSYRTRIAPFKHQAVAPVIMVIDNDTGSKEIFKQLSRILGKTVAGTDPYYHVFENLYIVPIPKVAVVTAIENLFEPELLKRTIDGRSFDITDKQKDLSKWYKKIDFANRIVKVDRAKIKFDGFEPLLHSVSEAQKNFAARLAL